MISADSRLVVLGGGTGTATILQGIKQDTEYITAIVNMADNGGSSGRLRLDYGVLPAGDVRQCLVALSTAPEDVRQLFQYRFGGGSLAGHAFGNLFLASAEIATGNFERAIAMAADMLATTGQVVPATLDNTHLVLERGGSTIYGETEIDGATVLDRNKKATFRVHLAPAARLNPRAAKALEEADVVVIAPGDIYSSLAPTLLVEGMTATLQCIRAPIVYVCNLTTKIGHTDGFAVEDHVAALERVIGAPRPVITHVIYNNGRPSQGLRQGLKAGEAFVRPIGNSLIQESYVLRGYDLLAQEVIVGKQEDSLKDRRSGIRHDSYKVALAIRDILGAR